MASDYANLLEQKKAFTYKEKSSIPTGLVWYTNMAAVLLFWNTNMAAVTSCENALFVVEVYFNTNPFDPSVLDRCLEMHSKWRYKICICSVILGELKSFRNYKGFSIIFLKIFDAIERFTKD